MQVISISLDIICIERDWLGILHYPRVSKKLKMPSKTWTSKQIRVIFFLLVNDEETKIIMFSTVSNLQLLCDSQRVFMDGTFKSCPKFYFQVFTLLGLKNNVYIPLVFLLLPGKTKSIYKQAFQHVKSQCSSLVGKEFYPSEVFADFELAIHGAIQDVWSDVIRRGCRFHLGQCWWRKIQTSGLANISITIKNLKRASF
uniref:MULE transposase domain-containing protein n=1 Tax=Cacopsylla melanoneura TaxID=428564 RepID=A0A8D8WDT8_9HEMI